MSDQAVTTPKKLTPKERFLAVAEVFDAYRIFPRAIVALYGVLLYNLYTWFTGIVTVAQTSCDAALIKILTELGEPVAVAQELACTVSGMVGGPTTAQAAFVATVVGVAAPIFAFYANTGRGWGKKDDG